MLKQNQEANENTTNVFKASWMRSSIKLGLIATIAGLIVIGFLKFFDFAGTQIFSSMSGFFLNYGLLGIFLVTIVAGTIVPLGSPALVVAAALFGINPVLLVFTTTLGFTIGMTINYVLAYRLGRPYVQKRVSPEHLEEITRSWDKYGWIIYIVFGLVPILPVAACIHLRIPQNPHNHLLSTELHTQIYYLRNPSRVRTTSGKLARHNLTKPNTNMAFCNSTPWKSTHFKLLKNNNYTTKCGETNYGHSKSFSTFTNPNHNCRSNRFRAARRARKL
jgi:membrane protein YqaA with SNARE-associated domain